MSFEIIGSIHDIETIASGSGVHVVERLIRCYGAGRWRKLKGVAYIRLTGGIVRLAELHWYGPWYW